MSNQQQPMLSTFFAVTIDGVDLGSWTELSGISMTIAADARHDSAVTFMQNHLPGHIAYKPLQLKRMANNYTARTMAWFSTYHVAPYPLTAEIQGKTAAGEVIMSWSLIGVTPAEWSGPSFKMGSTEHGVESLTLNHWGFI